MLAPTKRTRERILLYGGPGVGKSRSWLTIAWRAQKSGSDARFYCLDTDQAIDRMIDEGFGELGNVEVKSVFEWPEYESGLKEFLSRVRPEDWIICDMIDMAWEAVQAYFTDEVFGKDIGAYFLEARKAMSEKDRNLKTFDGWRDWQVINKLYLSWINKLVFRSPCHVLCTAKAEPINSDLDGEELKKVYGPYGARPKGQKHLGHNFHTVLFLQKKKHDEYTFTTVKDRERQAVEGKRLVDFALQYLVAQARWKV